MTELAIAEFVTSYMIGVVIGILIIAAVIAYLEIR